MVDMRRSLYDLSASPNAFFPPALDDPQGRLENPLALRTVCPTSAGRIRRNPAASN